jgi:hypothetical protein
MWNPYAIHSVLGWYDINEKRLSFQRYVRRPTHRSLTRGSLLSRHGKFGRGNRI